jgi:hypothetical protein
MCAGEVNAPLNLIHGVVDECDRALAMSAFVRFGGIELVARDPEIVHGGLHVRLAAAGCAAGEVPEDEQKNEYTGEENRSTIHPDLLLPLMRALF